MGERRDSAGVVIIGGGFGGITAAKRLGRAGIDTLLIDKANHHLFQPLLYQVATAGLTGSDIAFPIRGLLSRFKSVSVAMAEVTNIDACEHLVTLDNGRRVSYESLIIAVGVEPDYRGNDEWRELAPPLKSLEDAYRIRERVIMGFERAELAARHGGLTEGINFVVVGGGPTGVELAGAIAEIAHVTLRREFRHFDPDSAKVYLIEGGERVLSGFSPYLSEKAMKGLEKLGVEVIPNTRTRGISQMGVEINDMCIESSNIIWTAGNRAPGMLESLEVELDRMGRVRVEEDLSAPGQPDIFVIGDAACFPGPEGKPLPGIAPVAIQQARHVSRILTGRGERPAFRYRDKGVLATIGKSMGIARIGRVEFNGFLAWVAWLVVHLLFIILFRNKAVIFINWVYNYFTGRRGARVVSK